MAFAEHVEQLLQELGPLLEVAAIDRGEQEHSWIVYYDEDTAIDVFVAADQNKLTLAAEIGKPSAERQAYTYASMLQYNTLFQETGGVRIALLGADEPLLLLFDLFLHGLELPTICTATTNFYRQVLTWREIMNLGGLAPDEIQPNHQLKGLEGADAFALRV